MKLLKQNIRSGNWNFTLEKIALSTIARETMPEDQIKQLPEDLFDDLASTPFDEFDGEEIPADKKKLEQWDGYGEQENTLLHKDWGL